MPDGYVDVTGHSVYDIRLIVYAHHYIYPSEGFDETH